MKENYRMLDIIQPIINILYRYPMAWLRMITAFGGYFSYHRMQINRRLMEAGSRHLPPVQSDPKGFCVYFLTGRKHLYQTLFCIQSLSKCCPEPLKYILVDDGTLTLTLENLVYKQLPGAQIVRGGEIEKNIETSLPEHHFPALRRKRREYPHIKKLTDVHTLPGNGWKLVLDSDMLFWNNPVEIIEWLSNPQKPLYMSDCNESYGYSRKLLEQLIKTDIADLVNVGIIGLNSDAINWEKLESWVKILEEKEGKTYYLEQALTAMLVSGKPRSVLNRDRYIVNPCNETVQQSRGSLHHYVDRSKKVYFDLAWKKIC